MFSVFFTAATQPCIWNTCSLLSVLKISEACCIGEKRMAAYVSQKFESLNNTGAFINFYTILTHLVFGDTSCMFPLLFKL